MELSVAFDLSLHCFSMYYTKDIRFIWGKKIITCFPTLYILEKPSQ